MPPPIQAVVVDRTRVEPGFDFKAIVGACLKTWVEKDEELAARARVSVLQGGDDETPEQIVGRVLARKPAVVGFSCYLWNVAVMYELAALVRKRAPTTKIVLGGPEVGKDPEKTFEDCPAADWVCLDEGEETFRLLLRHAALGAPALEDIKGLAYRAPGGKIVRTAEMPLIELEKTESAYLSGEVKVEKGDQLLIELSRGCPLSCKYCDWRLGSMRYVPLERIRKELQLMVSRGASYISLADADILMNRRRGPEILRAFVEAAKGTDCLLSFDSNPTFLSREAVDVMAQAPENFLPKFGLQSVEEKVLELSDRAFDREKVEANLTYLKKNAPGVKFMFSLIYGLPGDDLDGYRRTLDFAYRWDPVGLIVLHALILPGAAFWTEGAALGVKFQKESPHHTLSTPTMTTKQLGYARELQFATDLIACIPALQKEIFGSIPDPDVPGARIDAIERWMQFVKDEGFDLFLGIDVATIGFKSVHSMTLGGVEKLKRDPLLIALLQNATQRFARKRVARVAA